MIEIEKRYLLKHIPDLSEMVSKEIEDRKIITGEPHPHLRLRKNGQTCELTKKYPKGDTSFLEMVEETIQLNEIEYQALSELPNTVQKKTRYSIKRSSYTMDIDIWDGDLKGLGIVEFEFENEEEVGKFETPDYCLIEVTDLEWLAGGMLSGKKFDDLEPQLNELGYVKLNEYA